MVKRAFYLILMLGVFNPLGIRQSIANSEDVNGTFRIEIDMNGAVQKSNFVDGTASGKVRTSLQDRIETWKFVPARVNSQSVSSATFITVEGRKQEGVEASVGFKVIDASLGAMVKTARPPKFPREAASKSVAAEVLLAIDVGSNGKPKYITTKWYFESAEGYEGEFLKAAHDQARTFRFELEEVNGEPQPTTLVIPVRFCTYAPFHNKLAKGSCNLLNSQIRDARQTQDESLDVDKAEDVNHRVEMGLPLLVQDVVGEPF